jgi:hypothetical protein
MSLEAKIDRLATVLETLTALLSTIASRESGAPSHQYVVSPHGAVPPGVTPPEALTPAEEDSPVEPPAVEEPATKEVVGSLISKAVQQANKSAVAEVLKKYGARNLTTLDATHYNSAAADLRALLN